MSPSGSDSAPLVSRPTGEAGSEPQEAVQRAHGVSPSGRGAAPDGPEPSVEASTGAGGHSATREPLRGAHGCAAADRCVSDPRCEVYPWSRVCQEADAGRTVPDLKRERAPFQPFKVHLAEGMPADLVLVTSPRRDDECRREVCDHTHEVAVRLPGGMAGALDDHDRFAAGLLSAPEARNAFQGAAYRRGVAEGARLQSKRIDALTRAAYADGRGDGRTEARGDTAAKIALEIRRELVCCDIYERDADTERAGQSHGICFWGEAGARIAESVGKGERD